MIPFILCPQCGSALIEREETGDLRCLMCSRTVLVSTEPLPLMPERVWRRTSAGLSEKVAV